jgi:hypothetical protein
MSLEEVRIIVFVEVCTTYIFINGSTREVDLVVTAFIEIDGVVGKRPGFEDDCHKIKRLIFSFE